MTLLSDKLSLLAIVVIVLEIALIVLVVSPERARAARIAEQQTAVAVYGTRLADKARAYAEREFGETFVESGFLSRLEQMLIPDEDARKRATGIEDLGTEPFAWVRERLATLGSTLLGVFHRAYLIGLMGLFATALALCALTDALVDRKAALMNSEITNAVFYHGAKGLLLWLLLLPILLTISPLTIRATALLLWAAAVPALLWVGARNVQEM
jgi:hypothetical protein